MLIIDAHLDLAMNALYLNRDLRMSAHELREVERAAGRTGSGLGAATTGLPDLRRGGVGLAIVTVLARVKPGGMSFLDFATPEIAYAQAQGQLACYRELARQGDCRLVRSRAELDAHLLAWEADPARCPLGVVLSMEGADPIVDPGQLGLWWEDGLRIASLAHYGPSRYAHGTASPGGLFQAGRELLAEMDRLGVALDVTHLADESFREAMALFRGPVLATHSNCRALVPGDRQLTDDMIRELIERGAVIGSALDAWMLQPGWTIGVTTPEHVTMETFVDHIDHVCQLAGNARHAAIGTDLDGGYGTEQTPSDLDTIADLTVVPELLARRGYGADDIDLVMHGNWARWLRGALPG